MKIILLSAEHDRSQFDCGESVLNEYLKSYAGQHARKDQSRTYVATDDDHNRVWGITHFQARRSNSALCRKSFLDIQFRQFFWGDWRLTGKNADKVLVLCC